MDFELNEDQLAFAEVAKQFADQMLAPHAAEWDENHHFLKMCFVRRVSWAF